MTEPHRNIHSLPHKWRAEMFCLHWSTGKNINQILFKLLSFLQDPVLGPTLSPEAAYSPSFRVAPWEEVGIRVKHPWLTLLSQEEPLVAQKVKSQPEMWFDPWVGKIPGGTKWQPTSVFLPLAWKIPWMEEPSRLQSMGLQSRTQLHD